MTAIPVPACATPGCGKPQRYDDLCADCYAKRAESDTAIWTGCKVFCATKASDREMLGEKVTEWLRAHPGVAVVDKVVTQSSDNAYHAITITLFYR